METVETVGKLVEREISRIEDADLIRRIRELLVVPYAVERTWDYGPAGLTYACWTVLEHRSSNTGIAYCAQGFGPADPWGLVFLFGSHMNIGMDSQWFASLEDAMRNSMAWEGGNPEGYEVR